MSKKILYYDNARKALEKGIDVLTEVVSVTLGPKGKNVVLEKQFGSPQIVNDGITIAKEIQLTDLIANTGAALLRQAASKTNDVVGDGTTTATILAHAIVKQGLRNVSAGTNPITLRNGIEKAVNFVVLKIAEVSRSVNDIEEIAYIGSVSAGNDSQIGLMIADALQKVGKEGVLLLEEGKSIVTQLEIKEGMKFDKGFISPYFITDSLKKEAVQYNPYILLTDKKITSVHQDLLPVLEQVAKTGRSLLIISEDIGKEALATLVVNKLRGTIDVIAVRMPGFGDRRKMLLEDIAILTSCQVISEDTGLTLGSITLEQLGTAARVQITKNSTTIIASSSNFSVKARCNQIRKQLELVANNTYEKEKLQERLAKLSGGIAIIKVGAATEAEMKDKKLRLEDAINATKAAIEEGVVPGGGSTLIHLSNDLHAWSIKHLVEEELIGALIVEKALESPLKRIVKNAGDDSSVVAEKIKCNDNFAIGFNAETSNFVNMYVEGIIDPAKVVRSALQNAASIASMILTTECVIAEKIEG